MGSTEQILTSPEISSQEIRLIGPPEELARVYCRARKLSQNACDGTCGDCKKHIKRYVNSSNEIRALLLKISREQSIGAGPDEEGLPNEEECRKILQARIDGWIYAKKQIIRARQENMEMQQKAESLDLLVDKRMKALSILALMPADLVDNTTGIQH